MSDGVNENSSCVKNMRAGRLDKMLVDVSVKSQALSHSSSRKILFFYETKQNVKLEFSF